MNYTDIESGIGTWDLRVKVEDKVVIHVREN